MKQTRIDSVRKTDDDDTPQGPTEVLEAIENLGEGNVTSKDDIEPVLKY
jgi:hypothetical protein